MLVDIHAHLAAKEFEKDLDELIERAKKAGVAFIVSNGIARENVQTLEIAEKYDIVKATLGLDPIEAEKLRDERIDETISLIEKNKDKIAGIGEVGLEGKYPSPNVKRQKEVFQRMIELSEKAKLPLIIHSRMMEQQAFEMVQSSNAKNAVFHCFSGRLSLAKKIAEAGHFVSITTNVVRDTGNQEIAKQVDINSLVTETDSPFLSPFPGKRNEPAFVEEAVRKIAELKHMKLEDAERAILANSKSIIK